MWTMILYLKAKTSRALYPKHKGIGFRKLFFYLSKDVRFDM